MEYLPVSNPLPMFTPRFAPERPFEPRRVRSLRVFGGLLLPLVLLRANILRIMLLKHNAETLERLFPVNRLFNPLWNFAKLMSQAEIDVGATIDNLVSIS